MICAVCSKPANGVHHTVLSCFACRSFFRISYKQKFPKCNFQEKCYEAVVLRKCKPCRLRKCVSSGMIMKTEKSHLAVSMKKEKTWNFVEILDAFSHLESKIIKFRKSSYNPISFSNIQEIIKSPIVFHLADKYAPMPGWPMSIEEFCQKQRTLKEKILMFEDRDEKIPSLDDPSINTKSWMLFDWISSANYVKTFDFFQKLSNVDKKKLIRASVVSVTNLTFFFTSFRAKKSAMQIPEGICFDESNMSVFIEFLLDIKLDDQHFERFYKNTKSTVMDSLIRYDITFEEYLFMKVLLICNPVISLSREGMKTLAWERRKFGAALFNFCLTQHGRIGGPNRFVILLNYVNCIIRHDNQFRQMQIYLRSIAQNRISESRKRLEDQILFP